MILVNINAYIYQQVYYINLTDASWVKDSHSYFDKSVVEKNSNVAKSVVSTGFGQMLLVAKRANKSDSQVFQRRDWFDMYRKLT